MLNKNAPNSFSRNAGDAFRWTLGAASRGCLTGVPDLLHRFAHASRVKISRLCT